MPDEPTVPEFTLPDWGTEGAPPEPTVPDEPDGPHASPKIEISVERPLLVTAGPLPARWDVTTIHGLVTGFGKSDKEDHLDAVQAATAKAVDDLRDQAGRLGATGVIEVSLTVSGRKARTVVIAAGTAVSFSR